jgi:hypothetical protein
MNTVTLPPLDMADIDRRFWAQIDYERRMRKHFEKANRQQAKKGKD